MKMKALIITSVGVVLLGLLLVALLIVKKDFFQDSWQTLTMPEELRSGLFVSTKDGFSKVITFEKLGFKETRNTNETILAISKGYPYNTKITFESGTSKPVLTFKGALTPLLFDSNPFISLSPNGRNVVFAQQTRTATSSEVRNWDVFIEPSTTRGQAKLSVGFAAFFIDDSHVVRFTESGIYVYNLSDSTSALIHAEMFPRIPSFLSLSPDRSLIAWSNIITRNTSVYRISPTGLEPVVTLNRLFSTTAQLGNDEIYELRRNEGLTEMWRHSFDGQEEKVYVFPETLSIDYFVL